MITPDTGRGDFSPNQRLIQLTGIALVIGALCGVVAVVLLALIRFFTNVFYYQSFALAPRLPSANHLGVWAIAVPVVGSLVVGLMARFGSERIRGHGIPEALEAILYGKSILHPKIAVLKPISTAISIGSGGPFGAEGPIIMTGGSVGSFLAQTFHLSANERRTLLVAGAAAGMAAVFASPLSAVLLAVELLLFEWKPRSLVPVAAASAMAAAIRPLLLGPGPLFPLIAHPALPAYALIFALFIGLMAGAFSGLISKMLYLIEDGFQKLPIHWMWWPAIGGLAIGIGGYFQPRALGVGYDVIGDLIHAQGYANLGAGTAASLVGVKALIWVIALASGTSGGVLAPLLMMGAGLGLVEASALSGPIATMAPLISMAAILGGMMRSPFTAVIFAFELTRDADALLPVMIASVAAYAFSVLVMRRSILTEKIARRGLDIFREYGVDPLERSRIREAMSAPVATIPARTRLSEMARDYFGVAKKHRGYPVVDENGTMLGMLTPSDLIAALGPESATDPELTAADLVRGELMTAYPDETCREAAERMAVSGFGRLPVIERGPHGKLVGIITRSDLLKPRVLHSAEEDRRETIIALYPRSGSSGR